MFIRLATGRTITSPDVIHLEHDSDSAAKGITELGKLRHLNVRYLWLQDQIASGSMGLHKVRSAL